MGEALSLHSRHFSPRKMWPWGKRNLGGTNGYLQIPNLRDGAGTCTSPIAQGTLLTCKELHTSVIAVGSFNAHLLNELLPKLSRNYINSTKLTKTASVPNGLPFITSFFIVLFLYSLTAYRFTTTSDTTLGFPTYSNATCLIWRWVEWWAVFRTVTNYIFDNSLFGDNVESHYSRLVVNKTWSGGGQVMGMEVDMISEMEMGWFQLEGHENMGRTSPNPMATGWSRGRLQGWSAWQLSQRLFRCGDVEANPGPRQMHQPLKVCQLNINGFHSHRREFEKYLEDTKPHLVLLQETMVVNPRNPLKINNYECFHQSRVIAKGGPGTKVKGGGIAILVRNDEDTRQWLTIEDIQPERQLQLAVNEVTQVLQVHLKMDGVYVMVSNVYVSPIRASVGETRVQTFTAQGVLGRCLQVHPVDHHIIAGDFNAHTPLWDRYCNHWNDELGTDVAAWLEDAHMVIGNTGEPTFTSRCQPINSSTPDVTLVTEGLGIRDYMVDGTRIGSDHKIITYGIEPMGIDALIGQHRRLPMGRLSKWSFPRADWERYEVEIDAQLDRRVIPHRKRTDVNYLLNRLLLTIRGAARKAIPRGGRVNPVPWWSQTIQDAVVARGDARTLFEESDGTDEEKAALKLLWLEREKATLKLINEERSVWWKERCSELTYKTRPGVVSRMIGSIGKASRSHPSVALKADGGALHSDAEKGEAFIKHYANVSSKSLRDLSQEEKEERRERSYKHSSRCRDSEVRMYCKRANVGVAEGSESLFTQCEFDTQLKKLPMKKEPGLDGIHNEMLCHLSTRGQEALLSLFNLCWEQGATPNSWLTSRIIPIPKTGKPPEEIASHRPVSMISNLAKLMERLVGKRLTYEAETMGVFTEAQSGYRAGRSTNDVLNMVSSMIVSGINKKVAGKHHRTVMALVDLTAAFDKVPHDRLLHIMVEHGFSPALVRWIKSWLTNRRSCVRVGNKDSRYRWFARGVPQGSVTGPLLFNIFISVLHRRLEVVKELTQHGYADDITLLAQDRCSKTAAHVVQKGLNVVVAWAKEFSMVLSTKSEAIIFTRFREEWQVYRYYKPHLRLRLGADGDRDLLFKSKVRLLGVWFDQMLTFGPHVAHLRKQSYGRLRQMRAVAGATFGTSSDHLRAYYNACIRSVLEYGAGCFGPLLSETALGHLETIQNAALRICTGCLASSPIQALYREAGNPSPLGLRFRVLAATARESMARMPQHSPAQAVAIATPVPVRLLHHAECLLHSAASTFTEVKLHRKLSCYAPRGGQMKYNKLPPGFVDISIGEPKVVISAMAPWETRDASRVSFHCDISDKPKKYLEQAEQLGISSAAVASHGIVDYSLYSDGALKDKGKTTVGVGACLIYDDRNGNNEANNRGGWLIKKSAPSGNLSTSFCAEAVGIELGLTAVLAGQEPLHRGGDKVFLVVSDSESVLKALAAGPLAQRSPRLVNIWKQLLDIVAVNGNRIIFQHVFSHCGLERNDQADKVAVRGFSGVNAVIEQAACPVPLSAVKVSITNSLRKIYFDKSEPMRHLHRYLVCGNDPTPDPKPPPRQQAGELLPPEAIPLPRRELCLLAQLRTGQCYLVGVLRQRLGLNARCRWCVNSPETPFHVYQKCQHRGILNLRREFRFTKAEILLKEPRKALLFLSRALALLPQPIGQPIPDVELRRWLQEQEQNQEEEKQD